VAPPVVTSRPLTCAASSFVNCRSWVSTHGNFAEFHDMLAFVSQHGIQPVIDHDYPMDQVHAALDRLASQQQFGKVGLNLQRE
jgi:D-arabinose 1-dehydrogenase-like Zn-dependent alcohol dehydrogenase